MEILQNAEKIKEVAEGLRKRVVKSELIKVASLVFLVLAFILFFLPLLLNNSQLKFQIEQKISGTYLANFIIRGNVEISFLPTPTITAKDVILRNYRPKIDEHFESEEVYDFYAKEIKIKSSFFSFSKIKSVIFVEPVLESYNSLHKPQLRNEKFAQDIAVEVNADKKIKNSGISSKLFSLENSVIKIDKLPSIIVKNGEFTIYDKLLRKQKFQNINFNALFSGNYNEIIGGFVSAGDKNNFKIISKYNSASSRPTSFLELSSPSLKLSIKGNFTAENNGLFLSDFKGVVEAEIFDLKAFYKNYVSAENVIHEKLKKGNDPIKISSNITSREGDILLNNLLINSSLIDGRGALEVNLSQKIPVVDINLDLENLDLDNILSNEPISESILSSAPEDSKAIKSESEEVISDGDDKIVDNDAADLEGVVMQVKDFDLSSEINIKNVKYLEGEIKNLSLYLSSSKQGEILLLPATFSVPGEGLFWISGVFDNNSIMPKFVGKVDAAGNDLSAICRWFKFEAQNLKFDSLKQYKARFDFLLSPTKTVLSNFYININNGQSEIIGEITSNFANKITNTVSKFTISDFNIDNYFLTSSQSTYLSPGMLIKKMLWLEDVGFDNDIMLRFYKLTYKGEEFYDQNVRLKVGKGRFAIDDLRLTSGSTDLRFSLNVDIGNNNPRFELSAEANDFRYNSATKSDYQTSLISSAMKTLKQDKKQNFLDRFYALPSLEGFDGKITMSFKNLELDDFAIKYAKLNGKIKDGNINVSEMSGDIYDGSFNYRGMIGIKINKIINGNLTLNRVSIQPMLSDLFGINNISGIANVSSSIVSGVSKKEKFAESLNSDIRFVVNTPVIIGYGLNDLIEKMFAKQTYQRELYEPEKILFNDKATSSFKEAKGTIQFAGSGDGKVRVDVSSALANGVLSGMVNLPNKNIDALFNVIFLTGNRQNQIPINIASNVKGDINNASWSTNFDQISQYLGLKSVKLNTTSVEK